MKKKYYNVDFVRVEKFLVSITVQAENEELAIEQAKMGNYIGQEIVTPDYVDSEYDFQATLDESGI